MKTWILPLVCVSLFALGCNNSNGSRAVSKKGKRSSGASAITPEPTPPPQPAVVAPEPVKLPMPKPAIRVAEIRNETPSVYDKALAEAILLAQSRLMTELQKLDPPISVKPSLTRIRNDYLKKDSIREIPLTTEQREKLKGEGLGGNRMFVECDFELSEKQVQHLRASGRIGEGMRGAGILLALIAAVYGFFWLDTWSKGYLTLWLGLAAVFVVLAAGFALAW